MSLIYLKKRNMAKNEINILRGIVKFVETSAFNVP